MTKLNEHDTVLMRTDSHASLESCYRKWLLLFSVVGWAEPKLDLKRRRTEQEGTIYVQNALTKRKTRNFSLETGADVGVQKMK